MRHFSPPLSSNEYQKLLFDEQVIDDKDENLHQSINDNQIRNYNNDMNVTTTNGIRMRQSFRRNYDGKEQFRHTISNFRFDDRQDQEEQKINDCIVRGLDISHDALQSLLNSKFKMLDLINLMKKTYPKLLFNDQRREIEFLQQVSETITGNREGENFFLQSLSHFSSY